MDYQTIRDLDLDGHTVLMRVDLNVPLDDDGRVRDDRRIRAALPTIERILDGNASIVLMSHLGRPGGRRDPSLSLKPVAERLGALLGDGRPIELAADVTGEDVLDAVDGIEPGAVLLLENLRFHPGETGDDEQLARELAVLGDVYVNDAFAASHRRHASVHALPRQFGEDERAIGLLVERELSAIDGFLDQPGRPLVAVMGGAKVADKLGVIEELLELADEVLLGGAMAHTFMAAEGRSVGACPVEDDLVDVARRLLQQAGSRLRLPTDHRVRAASGDGAEVSVAGDGIEAGMIALDIGPETASDYAQRIGAAGAVLWNGPLGKFEEAAFAEGTRQLVEALCATGAKTLVGGGETGEAIDRFGDAGRIDHVSTGGGAFLRYVRDRTLPALEVLATAGVR